MNRILNLIFKSLLVCAVLLTNVVLVNEIHAEEITVSAGEKVEITFNFGSESEKIMTHQAWLKISDESYVENLVGTSTVSTQTAMGNWDPATRNIAIYDTNPYYASVKVTFVVPETAQPGSFDVVMGNGNSEQFAFTSRDGEEEVPYSKTVRVVVTERKLPAPTNATITANKNTIDCGEQVVLTASATGESLTYTWVVEGVNVHTGTQYTPSNELAGKEITVKATNNGGQSVSSPFTFTVTHNEVNQWLTDAAQHWKECSNGHITTAKQDHTDVADYNGFCDTCGREIDLSTPTLDLSYTISSGRINIVADVDGYGNLTYTWTADNQPLSGFNSVANFEVTCADNGTVIGVKVKSSNGKEVYKTITIENVPHSADSDLAYEIIDEFKHAMSYDCGHKYGQEDHDKVDNQLHIDVTNKTHYYLCKCGYRIDVTTCSDKDGQWNTSSTEHWHVCECGNEFDREQHKDTNFDGKCDKCNTKVSVGAPKITTDLKDVTATNGSAELKVVASGNGTLTYTWYVKAADANDFVKVVGESDATLKLTGLKCSDNGTQYYVVVSNVSDETVTSRTATVTVGHDKDTDNKYEFDATKHWKTYDCGHKYAEEGHKVVDNSGVCSVCGKTGLPITLTVTGLTNQTVNHGEQATFSVTAKGDGVTYKWYVNDELVSGQTGSSYKVTADCSLDGAVVKVVVTETTGNPNESKTLTATLKVNEVYKSEWSHNESHHWHESECGVVGHEKDKQAHIDNNEDGKCDVCERTGLPLNLKITKQPVAATVTAEDKAVFTVEVKGNSPFTYQWYVNGQPVAGATSETFEYTTKCSDNNAEVYVTVTDVNSQSISSNPVKLTVNEKYSTTWSYDATHHYHLGTCGNIDHKADYEAHYDLDANGYCDVCDRWFYQQRIVTMPFEEKYITDAMKNVGLTTIEDVINSLLTKMKSIKSNASKENTVVVEAELQFFDETAGTWVPADGSHWPSSGKLIIKLPTPDGTTNAKYNFYVVHMFSEGAKAGTFETFSPREITENGKDYLMVEVTGLSPFMIYYEVAKSGSSSIVIPDTAVKGIDYSRLIEALEIATTLEASGEELLSLLAAMNKANSMFGSDDQFAIDVAADELFNIINSIRGVQAPVAQQNNFNMTYAYAAMATAMVVVFVYLKKKRYNDNTPVVEYNIADDDNK